MPALRKSVANVRGADVAAEGVVVAHQAGAIIRSRRRGGDRAADDGGGDQRATETPAPMEAMSFGLGGGGRDAAGDSESSNSQSGNLGLDRHGILHPVLGAVRCGPL